MLSIKNLKKPKKIAIFIIVIISSLFCILYFFSEDFRLVLFNKSKYTLVSKNTIKYSHLNKSNVQLLGNYIINSNKDGIKCFTTDGTVVWDKPYSMLYPNMKISNNYISVADINNNSVIIFDKDGYISTVVTKHKIIDHYINNTGLLIVVEQNDTEHFITLYDSKGTKIINRKTSLGKDGYPLSISISDDGKKMVTSYVTYAGDMVKTAITLFDLSSDGNFLSDMILGTKYYDNIIISEIKIVNNNLCVFLGDKIIGVLNIKKQPDSIWEYEIKNKIGQYVFTDNDYFIVSYTNPIVGGNNADKNKVIMYDYYGKILHEYNFDIPVSYIQYNNGITIIGTDRTYVGINKKGNKIWFYNSLKDIIQLLPLKNKKEVIQVTQNNIDVLKVSALGR